MDAKHGILVGECADWVLLVNTSTQVPNKTKLKSNLNQT